MNLALITQDFPPQVGGIETYSAELAKRFAKICANFLVIAPAKANAHVVDRQLPYHVQRIAASNAFLGLKILSKAPVIFKEHQINTVFHAQWQTLPSSVFARRRGVIDHIFTAAHARELLFNPFYNFPGLRRAYEAYRCWMLSEVDLFFPVSKYTATLLCEHGVPKDRIKVVINGTDPEKFYPTDTRTARKSIGINTKKILLTITRLVSRKGLDIALKAFKQVLKNHPDSCYVIVGEGPQKRELQNLAHQLQIMDSVRFVGHVEYHRLINYYNACDVFVMPSKTEKPNVEGFGIVFLEANACGKPVIGTFSGGIPSAIVNKKTGFLVNEHDIDALAKGINFLFTNEKKALLMGKRGRRRIEREANWDITAKKLIKLMQGKI